MGIDVKDLPPAYQEQALRKWAEQEWKKKRRPPYSSAASCQQATGKLPSKYHNKPTERVTAAGNVIHFQSQKEARRYDELILLEKAGEIRGLRLQVDFTLQEAYTDGEGRRVRAIRYKADFTYKRKEPWGFHPETLETVDLWVLVVEDVKSRATKTRVYETKKKLMREKFGIEIQEV